MESSWAAMYTRVWSGSYRRFVALANVRSVRDSRKGRSSTIPTASQMPPPQTSTDHKDNDEDDPQFDAHSYISSTSRTHSCATSVSRNTATRTTVTERLHTLETDELVAEVRESEVFCEPCKKWVRLSVRTKYSLVNWRRHAERVHGRRRWVFEPVFCACSWLGADLASHAAMHPAHAYKKQNGSYSLSTTLPCVSLGRRGSCANRAM